MITAAVVVAHLVRFGATTNASVSESLPFTFDISYAALGIAIGALWWLALTGWNTRDDRFLGAGLEEYKRVAAASLYLFGGLAILSYAARVDTARGYVGIALPLGLLLLLFGRWGARKYIRAARNHGKLSRRVLLIGGPEAVNHLAGSLRDDAGAGYSPVGAFLPQHDADESHTVDLEYVSRGSTLSDILTSIDEAYADTVAISSGSSLAPALVRRLGWELQARGVQMIMAPALTDVAGPRIHTQPIAGLPLIHVSAPELKGIKRFAKRAFDVFFAALGLVILAPFMLLLAVLIRFDDPGPVFFHQRRIGIDGRPFYMHKFRSMVVDAEQRLAELRAASEGNGVLFKMKQDPRITKLGAFIRRCSIDELPQLWNVLRGEMSLVGPRPPLPQEVDTYEDFVHRRLMVTPGITGLWQVSGRSDLTWDESVRLDLYYVENWSLTQDFIIILKTAKAVFSKSGAY
ncbi:sugar transferase [Zhihengliuella flava]|uniref:Exopolysaccharide biosynthesis polyprenyl glycosylphosphotransferase n=1 Tax=Zhihengliuella flava TaxID=1285193 RepID=A0A931DAP7_9MICC|nr:sugar transferase [Zhihengliuella flava]MBG6085434.1 exopolysaccharide biosynthesis polyprenyl glycosylphosphotransferase [Zhihengliuella flava]